MQSVSMCCNGLKVTDVNILSTGKLWRNQECSQLVMSVVPIQSDYQMILIVGDLSLSVILL